MMNHWYPAALRVGPQGTKATYRFMETCFQPQQAIVYAEFGIYLGDTARNVCERFPNAVLHLFDYASAVEKAREKLTPHGNQIYWHENSQKFCDSYNWSLMKLLEEAKDSPVFDYCFLDGAHTVAVDALTFFLCDRLLRVGGYMDFDDYGWRLRGSSLDPANIPEIALQYTEEQIDSFQVKMIVDLLVKPDKRYEEVLPNKVYRKVV